MSRNLWKKLRSLENKINDLTYRPPPLPRDPTEFCRQILRIDPTSYQRRLLESQAKRIVLRWARQTGKTTALACRCITHSALNPDNTTLIVAPGLRQSMILGDRIRELLDRIPRRHQPIVGQRLRTIFRFRNGSTITVLPNSENQLRGFTAHLIVIDEAAFFHNDESIFHNILPPMLATTAGTLIVSSTPWGKNTVFYALNQDPDYEKHTATWRDAVREHRYSPEFTTQLQKVKESRPQVFTMEYEAQFTEEVDTWLTQDLLAKCCSHDAEYHGFNTEQNGRFYMGIDLAERVDHTAIAVIQQTRDHLNLVHMHRPKKGTTIASAQHPASLPRSKRSCRSLCLIIPPNQQLVRMDWVASEVLLPCLLPSANRPTERQRGSTLSRQSRRLRQKTVWRSGLTLKRPRTRK